MSHRRPLRDVAALALRLGFTAFGGPAAHIGMLHDEVVVRRRWIGEQHFLDLLGLTNLIPGPNSTEMVIHVGYERAGWRGLIAGGVCFIAPAATISLVLAWLYVRYGTTPEGTWLLYGIKPVIIAVVGQALWNLGRTAIKGAIPAAVGLSVFALYLLGGQELVLLFGGGAAAVLAKRGLSAARLRTEVRSLLPIGMLPLPAAVGMVTDPTVPYSAARLFLTFLKIGATLYGGGYVLLAFLRNDFVTRYGWLTDQQLIDAVAVGQFTPGPLFTTATFVGYLAGGYWGAFLATVGIFLPAFVLVAALNPLLPRLRKSPLVADLLDGINVAALGLMAAVTWRLGRSAIVDWTTAVLAVIAAFVLLRFRVNSAWLVLGGAIAGLVVKGLFE
jgi:chromate transporter